MMKLDNWKNLTMKELENLTEEVIEGRPIQYQIGTHKLESTLGTEVLRTVDFSTMEIRETEVNEYGWCYGDVLHAMFSHVLMGSDD